VVVTNNVLVTPKIFAKLVLFSLRTRNSVCRNMSTEVTKEFMNKAMKIGETVQVRRPYRFVVTPGLAWQPQPLQDTLMTVKVDRPLQIGFQWDSIEKTLSLRDANELYAEPAADAMSATVNSQSARFCAQNTANYAGVPGTAPNDPATWLKPGDMIMEQGLPPNQRLAAIVNRRIQTAYITARSVYFNPVAEVSKEITTGTIVDNTLGYEIAVDQTIYTQQIGTFAGTPVIDATSALQADGGNNGTMTLVISGFNAGTLGANTINLGDKFTIANVYSVHPQTHQSTGRLQCFTALGNASDSSVAGTITLNVYPAITPASTVVTANSPQYPNVNAAAVVSAAVLFWAGTTGTPNASSGIASQQGLVMHKNAFAFVSVPLASPPSGSGDTTIVSEAKDPETGMWMSFIRAFDSRDRIWINRFDTLIGLARLYAEMAAVLAA
jgi:hypothetical protein